MFPAEGRSGLFYVPHQRGWVGNYGIMMYLCSGIPDGLNCNEPEEINFI
jgi:hypothetical protein